MSILFWKSPCNVEWISTLTSLLLLSFKNEQDLLDLELSFENIKLYV